MSKKNQSYRKVNKNLAESTQSQLSVQHNQGRGYTVIPLSQLAAVTGKTKENNYLTITTDQPLFYLNPQQRESIMRLCSPVLGIISSRMNRISGLEFDIVADKTQEEKIYETLYALYQMYKEFGRSTDLAQIVARNKIASMIRRKLPDVLPDLTNFDQAVIRWKKRIQMTHVDQCKEIKDWLLKPNRNDTWSDFVKMWVNNYELHGAAAVYKKRYEDQKQLSLFNLPGGTIIPFRGEYVSNQVIYFQAIPGKDTLIYFQDEISFSQLIPTAFQSYGVVPIEALINKVSETLLFDKLMAEQADGTKIPEKMIVIVDNSPFGDPDAELKVPISENRQKKIESKINTPVKGGIMTFSGSNLSVIDLSRENTMSLQSARQKDIREEIALVFNMSDQEINMMGDKKFSSNDTADQQSDMEQAKGINPIKKQLAEVINNDVLPYVFGEGFTFEFDVMKSEFEEIKLQQSKLNTGTYSINQIRIERGEMPYEGEQYNFPPNTTQKPDGTEEKPLNFKQLK